ncbi:MAG: arginine--tRNA ligase [Lachnospiraceae bacterium]|nr:arginine--tRNA ligase [Lachnospiraceae bacterium]
MKTLTETIEDKVKQAFAAAGYDPELGHVSVSNRPDLCEFQCNGAMAGAKKYHKAPFVIADEVAQKLAGDAAFAKAESVKPGFLNLTLSPEFLAEELNEMASDAKFGYRGEETPKRVVVDYGGANAAKPLHVGHLRSAVIGESIKRIEKYAGNEVTGDVHLGDWGLQMGLIIEQLRDMKPDLPYFDPNFKGPYPAEAPFTISELEKIYPEASARSKKDAAFAARAHEATLKLQSGDPACTAIWKHIMNVSKKDLKKNYDSLNVHFELWKGESDVQPLIPGMVKDLQDRGIAHESQGAVVVDVAEDSDKIEIPPCLVQKSDGAALYATSDLATILDREATLHPDRYIYVADKRQSLHFTQVFRTARKAGFVKPETELLYVGFGTMNGKDGKPFKTRDGGVMRLENLVADITDAVREKMAGSDGLPKDEMEATARKVGLAALKYGDLSNQASKDYVFDPERFSSFEGNTGPYILYTIVRINSILNRYRSEGGTLEESERHIGSPAADVEKNLGLCLSRFPEVMETAREELAPHKICQFMYETADAFSKFYTNVKILAEPDEAKKKSYLSLLTLVRDMLTTCTDLLGMEVPERM